MEQKDLTREYQFEDGFKILCRPHSCMFCEHCTDIFYDYTNGPYRIICVKDENVKIGMFGKCACFDETIKEGADER